jgi:ATP/maltotriose-dependent transcriptional regulator MalT
LLLNALLHGINGAVASAEVCLRELSPIAAQVNSHALQLMERNVYAGTLAMRSRLREAAEIFRQVIANGDEWNDLVVHYAHWQLAEILLEWNDLAGAEEVLRTGYRITVKTSAPLHRPRFHQYLAELAWARGDAERAHAELDRAVELTNTIGGDGEMRVVLARRARFWLASGYIERVRDWAREGGLDPSVEPAYNR